MLLRAFAWIIVLLGWIVLAIVEITGMLVLLIELLLIQPVVLLFPVYDWAYRVALGVDPREAPEQGFIAS
jgi:hypothetical protein